MSDNEKEDPFLSQLLDEVLANHDDLAPEQIAEMRWMLELAAKTHPTASAIVNRARPRKAPQRSGAQEKPSHALTVADDERREGTDG